MLAPTSPGTWDWAETDGVWSSINTQLWDINARLSFGTQPLSGQAYFDGQEKLATSSTGGLSFTSPTVHQNTVGLTTTWNAADLPTISATIQHMDLFDSSRQLEDQSTNDLFVSAKYNPVRPLSLFYTGRFEAEDDRKAELTTNSVGNTGTVAYGDQFFGQRLVLSASYTLTGTSTSIHAANGSGQVPIQRFPTQGLSLVEALPATPTNDKLTPNPGLIDGNLTASAGIDIGYAPSVAGDTNFRDVGAAFADALTAVNLIYVYVDRQLPSSISSAFQWTAYTSIDNQNWTQVPVTSVTFGVIDNRFEIGIQPIQAQYVKVVTRPLAVGVTLDRTYADIYVTEIRTYDVVSASSASVSLSSLTGSATGTLHFVLVRSLNLAYDFSLAFYHASATGTGDRYTWNIMNALSMGGQVSRIFLLSMRVEDFIGSTALASSQAAQSDLRVTAAAMAQFLPTLNATLTYQGQYSFVGSLLSRNYQTASFTTLAEFYRGVNLNGQVGYTVGTQAIPGAVVGVTAIPNEDFSTLTVSAGMTIIPNSMFTLGGTFSYQDSQTRIPGQALSENRTGVISGSLAFNPFPALSAAVSIGWYPWYTTPTTTENASVSFSPLPGGKLTFTLSYNQALDTASDTRQQIFSPGLRWNIQPTAWVQLYYTYQYVSNIAYANTSSSVYAVLTITL